MKRARKTYLAILLAVVLPLWAHAQPFVSVTDTNKAAAARESLLIGHGDMLHVTVFREPDLDQRIRVNDSGNIELALVGTLHVAGLTAAEAGKSVAQAYMQGQYLNHPQVAVLVEEYATQNVTVLGQVARPGAIPMPTQRSLLDVISLAGGLTEIADRNVTVKRGDNSGSATVFLPNDAQSSLQSTIPVYPGDTVIVPKAGMVYVLGDVARPGGYVMQNDARLTVLQAVAMASGINKTAKESAARLIRKTENGSYQEQPVALKEIEKGKQPDFQLQANDVLYVPFSLTKNIAMGAAGIVASASSAAVYAAH